jgi:hypothetical protein
MRKNLAAAGNISVVPAFARHSKIKKVNKETDVKPEASFSPWA